MDMAFRQGLQTSKRMMDSVMTGKSGGTITHTWVCIAKRSSWMPSHYLTKEQRDSIAIDIVDRV